MLFKIVISFLCVILFLYFMFCMILNTPIAGGGNVKELSNDIKHRWFWVISMYIGKTIVIGLLLSFLILIAYILFFL